MKSLLRELRFVLACYLGYQNLCADLRPLSLKRNSAGVNLNLMAGGGRKPLFFPIFLAKLGPRRCTLMRDATYLYLLRTLLILLLPRQRRLAQFQIISAHLTYTIVT